MDTYQIAAIAGGSAAAGIVPVAMRWLAKACPAEPFVPPPDFDRLKNRFKWWERLWRFALLPLAAALAFPIWAIIKGVADLHTFLLPPAEFKLVVQPLFWILPAMMLSATLCGLVWYLTSRRVFGPDYPLLIRFVDNKINFGVHSSAINRVISPIFVVLSTIYILIGLNAYILIGKDGIVISRIFPWNRRSINIKISDL